MTEPRSPRQNVDVRIATYNIHRSRGMDRRTMPARAATGARRLQDPVIRLRAFHLYIQ